MIRRIVPTSTSNRPKRRLRKKIGARKRRRYTLAQLIRAITEENRHRETDWGQPVGNEI